MASDKIRIGCVGTGQIGQSHLNEYSKIEGAELVALADVNEKVLGEVAEQHGVTNTYTDFRELLKRDDITKPVPALNNVYAPSSKLLAIDVSIK